MGEGDERSAIPVLDKDQNANFRVTLQQASKFYEQIGMASMKIGRYNEICLDDSQTLVKVEWIMKRSKEGHPIFFDATCLITNSRVSLFRVLNRSPFRECSRSDKRLAT
ncbi:hypothetical protein EBB07_17890 [Paenibacillaceae bacterium]|nr:hypothetical protein EBB07_17890 [Paenibacillaceae bacterium]